MYDVLVFVDKRIILYGGETFQHDPVRGLHKLLGLGFTDGKI